MKNYRLRITEKMHGGCRMYFTRIDGHTSYFSGDEASHALSNLIRERAAETRFKLEDAADGAAAAKVLQDVLTEQWSSNPTKTPTVEVI